LRATAVELGNGRPVPVGVRRAVVAWRFAAQRVGARSPPVVTRHPADVGPSPFCGAGLVQLGLIVESAVGELHRVVDLERLDWLSEKRLAAFLAGIRYSGSTTAEAMHARILAAPRGATGTTGAAAVQITGQLRLIHCLGCFVQSTRAPPGTVVSWVS
jgi:hypothetical protein